MRVLSAALRRRGCALDQTDLVIAVITEGEPALRADARPTGGHRSRIVAALLVGAGRGYGLASVLTGAKPAPPQAFARETARILVSGLAPSAAGTVDPMSPDEDTP